MKGTIVPVKEVQHSAVAVSFTAHLPQAYNASGGKPVYIGAAEAGHPYEPFGNNPYTTHPNHLTGCIGVAYKHLTGRSEGICFIVEQEAKNFPSSTRNGVTTQTCGPTKDYPGKRTCYYLVAL